MDGRHHNPGGKREGAGAPVGSYNRRRGIAWRTALSEALDTYVSDVRNIKAGQALDKIARIVVEKALDGDKDAIWEIGNRLDGKPHQSVSHSGEDGSAPIQIAWPLPRTKLDE